MEGVIYLPSVKYRVSVARPRKQSSSVKYPIRLSVFLNKRKDVRKK